MDREGFRNRMKQYKEAKGFDPLLKYWDWKLKYDSAPPPDEMPSQPQLSLPIVTSQPLDNRAHRWDNGYVQTNRQYLDSPYEDARYYDYSKPRFELRKGDVHYGNPKLLNVMGKMGKFIRGGSMIGEVIQQLFPSEEVEAIESLRVNMQKQNNYLTGKDIPKYDEGTENVNLWEPRITAEGYDNKGYYAQAMNFLPEVTVVGSKTRTRSERPIQFTYVNGYPEATTITTDYNVGAGALERVYPEFEILTGAKLLSNSLLSNSLTNELKFNNQPLSRTRKVNRNSAAAKRHLGTYNQSTDEISGNTIGTLLTEDGSEQFVFNSFRKNNEVFKMPHAYGRRSIEDLYKKALEYLKFNKVPNYSKVRLEGHVDNGRGVLYPVFSQKRLLTLNDDIYSISGNQRWNNEIMPSLDKAMSKYGYKNIDGKYIKGNKIVGDIHPGNVAYDANRNIKLIDVHIDGFAEGGEVTGPPTYEQWDTEMNQYNPTILDNASMYWSIEAAKKALHNEAMKLPGYAERWTEYYRSLPKNDPDINEFVDELWVNENPNNVGLKNGKYYPHKSPEGGKPTIGPGFKIGSGSHRITKKLAERGMTKARLNQEARYIGKQHLNAVDQFINYGQTTNPADTVSPQIKMGLMDLRHQVGPLNEWGNLRQAVLNGDLEGIRKESTVTWNDNGKTKVDKRRKKIRDERYFYYE